MNELVVTPRDILFECPSCLKSLVVDEAAEGMIVNCPKCRTSVIVPPKPAPAFAPPPPTKMGKPVEKAQSAAEGDDLRGRLVTITGKLKELEGQDIKVEAVAFGNKGFGFLNRIGAKVVSVMEQDGTGPIAAD